jgi:hypothetical protein
MLKEKSYILSHERSNKLKLFLQTEKRKVLLVFSYTHPEWTKPPLLPTHEWCGTYRFLGVL